MEARAYLNNVRISPRKVKIVLDQIRGKSAEEARAILRYTPKAACEPLLKLLHSAIANGTNNNNMDYRHMYISECFVTAGRTMKRIRPVSKGRAHQILKRSSRITLALRERE